MIWQNLKDGGLEGGEKIKYYKLPKRFKLLVTHSKYEKEIFMITQEVVLIVCLLCTWCMWAKFLVYLIIPPIAHMQVNFGFLMAMAF